MYKNTGLAEIVRDPSAITRKYLDVWFTGSGAYGQALTRLGWPITKDTTPLLSWDQTDGLRLDLKAEERVMYGQTIFHYVKKADEYVLQIDPTKFWRLSKIVGTAKALWSQSKLLVNYQQTYNQAKSYVENIPLVVPVDRTELEKSLCDVVWPSVIMVDYMGEFVYSALTNKLSSEQAGAMVQRLHDRTRIRDWYTKSILAWSALQDKEMDEEEFWREYGYSSTEPYELTKPRYYEILKMSKPKIVELQIEQMEIKSLEDLYVGLQYLRSEAKRRSLIWIAELREIINLGAL